MQPIGVEGQMRDPASIPPTVIAGLEASIEIGDVNSMKDLQRLLAVESCEGRSGCPTSSLPSDAEFMERAAVFFDSVYAVLGITDTIVKEALGRLLLDENFSAWGEALCLAASAGFKEAKNCERERLVPFGVRLSEPFKIEYRGLIILFVRSLVATSDHLHTVGNER